MVNIYDNANQLAKDLQETEQFKDLKKSLENLKNNPESLDLYQRMDKLQQQNGATQNAFGQPPVQNVNNPFGQAQVNVNNPFGGVQQQVVQNNFTQQNVNNPFNPQ